MKAIHPFRRFSVFWLTLAAIGCDGDQPPPSLTLRPAEASTLDAEAERLRRMQMITVIVDGVATEQDEGGVQDFVASACQSTSQCPDPSTSGCSQPCQAVQFTCEAKTFLALTRPQGLAVTLPRGRYQVPDQGEPAKQTFGKLGLQRVEQYVHQQLIPLLETFSGRDVNATACVASDTVNGVTLPRFAASSLAEAYDLYKQLVDAYVKASVNSADAELSSTTDTGLAAARAMTQRLAAAKKLGGEVDELPKNVFPGGAFCTRPSASPAVRAAIAVIRDAAVDPEDLISNAVSTSELINGSRLHGSVRQRLANFYFGAADPASMPPATLPNGKTVGAQYGLEPETFEEARAYLRDEFLAFARSKTAKLPRRKRPDGTDSLYQSYAATASAPSRLPAAYYGAWARGHNGVYPSGDGETENFSAVFTKFFAYSQEILGSSQGSQALDNVALGPLALMIGAHELEGFVMARDQFGPSGLSGRLASVLSTDGSRLTAADGIKLALNEDDLRCAVQGSIEGGSNVEAQPCSLTGLRSFSDGAYDDATYVYTNLASSEAFDTGVDHAYLLRPRKGPAPMPQTTLSPGAYEAIAGINLTGGTAGFPIVAGNEERIAALIEPSRDWCAHPRVECSGGTFDERIALENELTDDGNSFEDSWKHYLALAKAAADEADALGNDYINQSLQETQNTVQEERIREQQLESARRELSRLQQLCGFKTDTQALLRELSDHDGNVMPLTGGDCQLVGNPSTRCANGYRCLATGNGQQGICRFDLDRLLKENAKDPDIGRISDCINQSERLPFVSLGDVPLCLWSEGNQVCKGATRGQCPQPLTGARIKTLKDAGTSDVTSTDPVARGSIKAQCEAQLADVKPMSALAQSTVPLGYFELPTEEPNDGSDQVAYTLVRQRNGKNGLPQEAVSRNLLAPATLYPIIQGLNWESRFDEHAAITYFGKEIYSTGSAEKGVNPLAAWPCQTKDRPMLLLDTKDQPLSFDCSTKEGRKPAIEAMFKAFVAAKLLARPNGFQMQTDDEGRWLLMVGVTRYEQWIREKISHHWWQEAAFWVTKPFTDAFELADERVIPSCGDFKETPTCDASQLIRRQDNSPVVKTSCLSGMAYSEGSIAANADFGNLGCFHKSQLRVDRDVATRGALAGLSAVFPATGTTGGEADWLVKFFSHDKAVQSSQTVATLKWESDSAVIPGGIGGSHDHQVQIKGTDLLMGLGLVARSAQQQAAFESPIVALSHPPSVTSVEDLEAVGTYVDHVAATIRKSLGTLAFADVPLKVVDALRSESAIGAFPQFGGEMATHISNARAGLLALHDNGPLLANEVVQIGGDIRSLRNILRQADIDSEIRELELSSQITNQLTSCAEGMTNAVLTLGIGSMNAALTCGNSIAQIGFAQGIAQLAGEKADLQGQLQVGEFGTKFSAHATAMQTLTTQSMQGAERFDEALASIERTSSEARSTLLSALQQGSFQAQHAAELTSVLANLSTSKQVRYQQALESAKRLAFVAKRAIEQRLGVRLAEQKTPYPLVDAPALWEGKLCSMTGIDYNDLKAKPEEGGRQSYAEGFIGDYVRNLEKFVESYSLENNFHEGTDTAVISLRDDIMNTRALCPVASPNFLVNAGQLDLVDGWRPENCPMQAGSSTMPEPDCIILKQVTSSLPFKDIYAARGASGYEISFGLASTSTSRLTQSVVLEPGLYRFTWFTKDGTGSGFPGNWLGGAAAGTVVADPSPTPVSDNIVDAENGWKRRYTVFRLTSPTTVKLGFQKVGTTVLNLAGPMLEQLEDSATATAALIPFVNTTNVREEILPACHDDDGSTFRQTRWQRGCVKLCEDGFADHCTSSNSRDYCYWQTEFGFSQRDIQKGKVFNFGGFARGNFNYRIESVGLNFVGTEPHNCSDSQAPEACYAAGYLPYSLSHIGPFFVRNYRGDDVETKLFDGNIEHARGLALERYLTSPLSSADSALVSQFSRSELTGRPLDGNFTLRVWDENGVDFNAIKDVQLVLGYRYWTKFD